MPIEKRELRRLKREIKRAGVQRSRRLLKRSLTSNPEEAQEAEIDYGRLSSASMNGLDNPPRDRVDPVSRSRV